eukprot:s630_g9.t1
MCLPCLLHGDEGVGHRRKPVMQMLWGPLLRVGLGAIHRLFLVTCCPHKYYSKYNQGTAAGNTVLDKLMVECGRSAARAYYSGIETSHGRFHLVFLGLAGDHPFQVKMSHSVRSHLKVDICPWCEANVRDDVPFEDFSLGATWRKTVFQSVPWAPGTQPPMVLIPGGDHPGFLKWDLMHMIPHGCARNFCASITCMLCGPMQMFAPRPGPTKKKERCLDAAYEHFEAWLACTGQCVRDLKEFSPENLQWINNRDFPDSNCKAADTTLWIKWLLDLLGTMPWEWQEPLDHAYQGLLAVDQFVRLCYNGNDRLFFGPEQQKAGSETLLRLREVNLLDPDGLTRDFSFRPLVAFLSVTRLSQLFVLTLQERKVVLSSQQLCPALLVVILEALRALLFPLEWEHTYLPILPNSFRWALESPAPFLMGVSGSPITPAELPEDVVVFDLDTGKTLPEKMQVTVPQIIEQPLARLRNAHQWEQRPANKGYWAKYDHIRLGRPEVEAETPSPESPRGRTLRHRRSHSSTSAESGDDSDGLLSIQSSNLLSGAMGPAWTEEQERGFRQKVTAIFLEAMVLLLHRCPELSQKVQDTPESPTKSKDADAEKALLEEVRRSNAWERFMALPSNSPRRQLFDQAIRLYSFWSQEPAESRKPLDHYLRDWVTRLYEPPQLICLSELSVLRCGQLQPQIPIKKLLQQRLTSKKRSRYLPLGELNLKELFEVEVKKEKPERPSCTGVPSGILWNSWLVVIAMSKRHRDDQWQQRGPKFHFVLWENCPKGFVYEPPLRLEDVLEDNYRSSPPVTGPRLCLECDGVVEAWKRSLDLVHCCMRMTAKEGRAFRPEVLHLAALSPQTAISYTVESFRLYNKKRRKNVLTESTVLAVPVHVMEGHVSPHESGVAVEQLRGVVQLYVATAELKTGGWL